MRKKTACSCGCKDFEKVDLTARNSNHSIFFIRCRKCGKVVSGIHETGFFVLTKRCIESCFIKMIDAIGARRIMH